MALNVVTTLAETGIGFNTEDPIVSIDASAMTDAFAFPVGNTTQYPTQNANGMIRYSNTFDYFEGFIAGAWRPLTGEITVKQNNAIINLTSRLNFNNSETVFVRVTDDVANAQINIAFDSLGGTGNGDSFFRYVPSDDLPLGNFFSSNVALANGSAGNTYTSNTVDPNRMMLIGSVDIVGGNLRLGTMTGNVIVGASNTQVNAAIFRSNSNLTFFLGHTSPFNSLYHPNGNVESLSVSYNPNTNLAYTESITVAEVFDSIRIGGVLTEVDGADQTAINYQAPHIHLYTAPLYLPNSAVSANSMKSDGNELRSYMAVRQGKNETSFLMDISEGKMRVGGIDLGAVGRDGTVPYYTENDYSEDSDQIDVHTYPIKDHMQVSSYYGVTSKRIGITIGTLVPGYYSGGIDTGYTDILIDSIPLYIERDASGATFPGAVWVGGELPYNVRRYSYKVNGKAYDPAETDITNFVDFFCDIDIYFPSIDRWINGNIERDMQELMNASIGYVATKNYAMQNGYTRPIITRNDVDVSVVWNQTEPITDTFNNRPVGGQWDVFVRVPNFYRNGSNVSFARDATVSYTREGWYEVAVSAARSPAIILSVPQSNTVTPNTANTQPTTRRTVYWRNA